jgi:pyruvate ferredoxin oxidoreductase delta subunit
MNRPSLVSLKKPEHIRDYPVGPSFQAGFLTSVNSGWRTIRPLLDASLCVGCWHCYLCCPDGVIFKSGDVIDVDYDFCKGCGVCANVCPKKAISMVKEQK